MRILISDDALAIACGADRVAAAFANAAPDAEIVRVSSWGMHWLEPLIEIEIDGKRTGHGPVAPSDVRSILDGTADTIRIGDVVAHPFIAGQTRLTFARAGKTRPLSLDDYEATGGWAGLRATAASSFAIACGYSERT